MLPISILSVISSIAIISGEVTATAEDAAEFTQAPLYIEMDEESSTVAGNILTPETKPGPKPKNEVPFSSKIPNEDSNTLIYFEKTVTPSDLTEDLATWEAPLYIQKSFPYYQSGFDDDGRPVWIMECGKFLARLRQILDQVEDKYVYADIEKYTRQAMYRMERSIRVQNSADVADVFFILDFEGLVMKDMLLPKVLLITMKILRAYKDLLNSSVGAGIVINVNYAAELLLAMAKPITGRVMEKLEFYGTNAEKWKHVLRRRLPIEAIPTWYDGLPDFKPLQVYG